MRNTNQIVMDILQSREDLADLCEYLDTCHDLYDLGYINSKVEQSILNQMSEESALTLWSIYKYATEHDLNHEHTFNEYVKTLKVDEKAMRENEVRALVFFRQFNSWDNLQEYLSLADESDDPILPTFRDMPDSLLSACYFYATGFDEQFKSIFDEYLERL